MIVLAPGDENTAWIERFVLLDGKPVVKAIFDFSACPKAERGAVLKIMQDQIELKPIKLIHKARGIEAMAEEEEAKELRRKLGL